MGWLIGVIVIAVLILWARANARANDTTLEAMALNGAKPAFAAKGRLYHSASYLAECHGEHGGVKITLALYKGAPLVRVYVHNNYSNVLNIPFDDIREVRYFVAPNNVTGLSIPLLNEHPIGDTEVDELLLAFKGDSSVSDVFDQLRDWLEPSTECIFQRLDGSASRYPGRGGALRQ